MPIYEYACQACGHELEANQRFSEAPLTKCPSCSQDKLERLVSRSSFALKGSGWYADGYGASKTGGDGGSAKKASTPESKPESSPAPTPATPAPASPSSSGSGSSAD
jgi:putative FmdB family regulatory protein